MKSDTYTNNNVPDMLILSTSDTFCMLQCQVRYDSVYHDYLLTISMYKTFVFTENKISTDVSGIHERQRID